MMGPGRGHRGRKGAHEAARAKDFKGSFGRLLGEFKPLRMKLVLVLLAVAAANIFNITAPRVVEHAIDIVTDALKINVGIDFSALARVLVGLLCLYALSSVFRYFQEVQMVDVTQEVMFALRRKVDEKLGRLPLSYFDRNERGDILSRATNDIDNVASSMQQTVTQVLSAAVTLVGVLIMMLSLAAADAALFADAAPHHGRHDAHYEALAAPVRSPMGGDGRSERAYRGDVYRP